MTVHEQLCFITTKIETYNKGIPYGVSGTGFSSLLKRII